MSWINKLFNRNQKFWLFYAGPENYLDKNGEINFQGEILWSCESETRKGDLILLYRKSLNQLTVGALVHRFGMTEKVAHDIKKREVGKDISALWQVVSDATNQIPEEWKEKWQFGCSVCQIQKLNPPIKFEELKGLGLQKWESFRRNFAAEGHSALEIPPFAWEILSQVIESKCGLKIKEK